MQLLHTVTLVFCISAVFSFKHEIRQSAETTTNEIDNSIVGREPATNYNQDESNNNAYGLKTYGDAGGYQKTNQVQINDIVRGTSAPQTEETKPMPTTGCFGHLPEDHNENNNVENIPQQQFNQQNQVNGPFNPQNQGYGPFNPQNQGYGPFNPQNQGYGPFTPHHGHFPHHHHPHFPHYPQNPWSPWRRSMPFNGPQPWSWSPAWRRPMPFVMPPGTQMGQHGFGRPPLVIVKLLQPIILPVAKRFNPEGGDRDPESEDIDGGFQRLMNARNRRLGFRRFGGERTRSFADRGSNGHSTFGPYKINGENVDISIKLH